MLTSFLLVDDKAFEDHEAPPGHPERRERLEAARSGIETIVGESGFKRVPSLVLSDAQLALVHSDRHIENLERAAGQRGYFDADTFYSPRSVAAAKLAAGGAIALVDQLLDGPERRGVALVRPPGHHATRDTPMGFCLINNAAVAAAHALERGMQRVAIVDFDVHHGNGTEDIFYDSAQVLYVSLHQAPLYPGTGAAGDVGHADGVGFNVNLPLSAGADADVYREALRQLVCPVLEQHAPELLILSAGYDAHKDDPLAAMLLESEDYAMLTRGLLSGLREPADTPILVLLEGGYELTAIRESLAATIRGLTGSLCPALGAPSSPLSPRHETDLAGAMTVQRRHWSL